MYMDFRICYSYKLHVAPGMCNLIKGNIPINILIFVILCSMHLFREIFLRLVKTQYQLH